MATPYNVVVIVGSLRKESFTLKIAKALAKLAPDTLKLNVVTLHDISFFNQDLETQPRRPIGWRFAKNCSSRTACCSSRPNTTARSRAC